jgi:molybdenum cofactor cytidylyltransferase
MKKKPATPQNQTGGWLPPLAVTVQAPAPALIPLPPVAILLASGKSSRMGEPKILLTWQGKTLLESALSALRILARRTIAVLPHDLAAAQKLARSQGADVVCGDPEREMTDSLRRGLAAIAPGTPVFVAIGDQPLGPYPWLKTLAGIAGLHPDMALVPMHRGKKGHPAFLPGPLADRLRSEIPPGRPARAAADRPRQSA